MEPGVAEFGALVLSHWWAVVPGVIVEGVWLAGRATGRLRLPAWAGHGVLAAGLGLAAALAMADLGELRVALANPPELELLETFHPHQEDDGWRIMFVYKVTGAYPGRLLIEAASAGSGAFELAVGNYIRVQPVFSEDIAGPPDSAGPSRWILRPAAGQITVEVLAADPYEVEISYRFE